MHALYVHCCVGIQEHIHLCLLQVGAAWGGLWGSTLRSWIPHWNIQPGLYGVMAGASVLAGVFRQVKQPGAVQRHSRVDFAEQTLRVTATLRLIGTTLLCEGMCILRLPPVLDICLLLPTKVHAVGVVAAGPTCR